MALQMGILPPDQQLHEYVIHSVLGSGSFGITYKARDNQLDTWVALKEYFPVDYAQRAGDSVRVEPSKEGCGLRPAKGDEPVMSRYEWGLRRFLSEAQVLAQVKHPNVVRVNRYFRANGTAYIVMDYEEGEPLSQLLHEEGILSEENVRGLLADIVPALKAVHDAGYLHRDLKPDNLYVRERDGGVVLIDFGAARATMEHSRKVTAMVTPGYSPPEQHLAGAKIPDKGKALGAWSDIYSLGAVLYHCIVGSPPPAAAMRLVDDNMVPAREIGAGSYSTALLTVIDRALALLPEHRYRDVNALTDDLARLDAEKFPSEAVAPRSNGHWQTSPEPEAKAASASIQRDYVFYSDGAEAAAKGPSEGEGDFLRPFELEGRAGGRSSLKLWLWMGMLLLVMVGLACWYLLWERRDSSLSLLEQGELSVAQVGEPSGDAVALPPQERAEGLDRSVDPAAVVDEFVLAPEPLSTAADLPLAVTALQGQQSGAAAAVPLPSITINSLPSAEEELVAPSRPALDPRTLPPALAALTAAEIISEEEPYLVAASAEPALLPEGDEPPLAEDVEGARALEQGAEVVAAQDGGDSINARRASEQIRDLLGRAEQSLLDYHLTTPRNDSALYYYDRVLAIDPGNPDAERGMRRIADGYVRLARIALEKGQVERARRYIHLGLAVVPDYPPLTSLTQILPAQQQGRGVPKPYIFERTRAGSQAEEGGWDLGYGGK